MKTNCCCVVNSAMLQRLLKGGSTKKKGAKEAKPQKTREIAFHVSRFVRSFVRCLALFPLGGIKCSRISKPVKTRPLGGTREQFDNSSDGAIRN